MATNYPVCITHVKWAPCLIKSDYEKDCCVVNRADAKVIVSAYHSGIYSREEVAGIIDNDFDHKVQWVDGIS